MKTVNLRFINNPPCKNCTLLFLKLNWNISPIKLIVNKYLLIFDKYFLKVNNIVVMLIKCKDFYIKKKIENNGRICDTMDLI